jgi:protease-4
MKRFLIVALVLFAILLALIALLFLGLSLFRTDGKVSLSNAVVLELDLEQGLLEYRSPDPFDSWLNNRTPELFEIISGLERAAQDDRVVALVARVGNVPAGLAQIQELRDAIRRFGDSGKRTVAWAETFGESGPANGSYYLATAFDEIYLQPSGDVSLTGLSYEVPFVAGALEKAKIEPMFGQRREYKNAVNTYTERQMTAPHREAMQALLDSQFGQLVTGIAEGRELEEDAVRILIDKGPYYGEETLDSGLVDGLMYRDEIYEGVLDAAGERARLVYLDRYLTTAGSPWRGGTRIALIHGVGSVMRGPSGFDPLTGDRVMGAQSVASAIRTACKDRSIDAILLRVDSPGGSYVASDSIHRETQVAREAGIPVIISMGNLAASGGYFVSMGADHIVAQPGTITGSIGVYGGKFYTRELWARFGITWDHVQSGSNAMIWNSSERRTAAEERRFQVSLDRIYEDFTGKVAEGRGLDAETVARIARGRVWTGEDALALGLVDSLGGFQQAFVAIRELLDLEVDEPLSIRRYPRPMTAFEALFAEPAESSDDAVRDGVRSLQRAMISVAPLREAVGLSPVAGPLQAPPGSIPQPSR